MDTLLYTICE